jgi:GT2 family glycosyltransferase
MDSPEMGHATQRFHVLTVHFNTPVLTSRLIQYLPRHSPQGRRIYIHLLDNDSTPQNLAVLRAKIEGVPNVKLRVSKKNLGFGSGVNLLAKDSSIADSDIIWIVNPDTRPDKRCIDVLENELTSGKFSIISPLIYSGDEKEPRIWYCGGTINVPQLRARHHYHGHRLNEAPSQPFETEFITGTAPMMLASTFRAAGCFPDDYFLYWEDAFLSWRIRQLGLRLAVVPSATLWHSVGASSGGGQSRTSIYWSTRNRFKFAQDIGIPTTDLIVGRGLLETLRPIARALISEREDRILKFCAAVVGTRDGLRLTGSRLAGPTPQDL